MRRFRGDKWTRAHGSAIPIGATVRVLRFYQRRRVLVDAGAGPVMTMLWCLVKLESS